MRKIVAGLFMSLDGVVEAPEQWHFPYMTDGMQQAIGAQLAAADTLLLGRRTYLEFAGYWTRQGGDVPLAEYMNATPKPVVATTPDPVEWRNSTLLTGDLAEELGRRKRQPGKNLLITGSITLVRSLLRAGLLDELELLVHPIVVGRGKRLFEDVGERVALKLVDARIFRTGVLHVTYQPAGT